MAPSMKSETVVSSSSPGAYDDLNTSESFSNDAMGVLGTALTGMTLEADNSSADAGSRGQVTSSVGLSIFETNRSQQQPAGNFSHVGSNGGLDWAAPSASGANILFSEGENGGHLMAYCDGLPGSGMLFANQQRSGLPSRSFYEQAPRKHEGCPSTPLQARRRGESIDNFLSRSPSQSLGEDFLKFVRSADIHSTYASKTGEIKPIQNCPPDVLLAQSTRQSYPAPPGTNGHLFNVVSDGNGNKASSLVSDSSPSCSATGTTASSRSVSPNQNQSACDTNFFRSNVIPHFQADNCKRLGDRAHHNLYQSRQPLYNGATNQTKLEHPGGALNCISQQATTISNRAPRFCESKGGHASASFGILNRPPGNEYVPAQLSTIQGLSHQGIDSSSKHRPVQQKFPKEDCHFQGQQSPPSQNCLAPQQRTEIANMKGTNSSFQLHNEHVSQDVQSQQLFYMDMPTGNGHGQVIQPIQMVQLSGQPPALVYPPSYATNGLVAVNDVNWSIRQGQQDQMHPIPTTLTNGINPDFQFGFSNNNHIIRRAKGNHNQNLPHYTANRYGTTPRVYGQHSKLKQHGDISGNSNFVINALGNDALHCYDERQKFYSDSLMLSPYVQGDYYSGTLHHTTPSSSQRNSPRSSPTPHNDFIASLYSSPHRPHLDDLLGHVRRLSRDQVGCRLLQQSLDEEGATAATLILNEGLSFWGEVMVDPFGNYLFQKILEKITAEERVTLISCVGTRLVNACLNLHGTRSVQKVVDLCAADEVAAAVAGHDTRSSRNAAETITRYLAPSAARLCIDSHGNHVIQRILLKLSYRHSQFVFDAVAASVGDVARHRHGCCVIQRCLDSSPSPARSHLVCKIVEKSLELMQDAYGNYVVQYVLDVCSEDDVHAVCESVVGKVNLLAIQKFSSNVMEKCFERSTERVREKYLNELSNPDCIRELMMDPFGNYVIQRALTVATHAQAMQLVESLRPYLLSSGDGHNNGGMKNFAGGRRILAKICKRFPNFNIGGSGLEDIQPQEQKHVGGTHYPGNHHGYRQAQGHYVHEEQSQSMALSLAHLNPHGQPKHLGHYGQNSHHRHHHVVQNLGNKDTGKVSDYLSMGNGAEGYLHM